MADRICECTKKSVRDVFVTATLNTIEQNWIAAETLDYYQWYEVFVLAYNNNVIVRKNLQFLLRVRCFCFMFLIISFLVLFSFFYYYFSSQSRSSIGMWLLLDIFLYTLNAHKPSNAIESKNNDMTLNLFTGHTNVLMRLDFDMIGIDMKSVENICKYFANFKLS